MESYGVSDMGLIRTSNEDAWAELHACAFFILADGMGGHQAGEVASTKAVHALAEEMETTFSSLTSSDIKKAENQLKQMIMQVNKKVYRLSRETPSYAGMGTTLACLWIYGGKLIYGHVGDSRIYRFRQKTLTQLTEDHSLRQEMIAKGTLNLSHSASFKNIITRAIGTQAEVVPVIQSSDLENEDIYFLCSDGLTDELSTDEIKSILLKSKTIKQASDTLVAAAKAKGGSDNITIVMVKIFTK